MDQSNAGVDPRWIAGNDFIQLHLDLVDALDGDFHAALLLDRIKFRAGTDGWWTATREEMQAATRLTEWQLRKASNKLRELGYVESERLTAYNPVMRWRVVIAGMNVNEESSITTVSESHSQGEESSITNGRNSPSLPLSKNSKELSKNTPLPPDRFDEFWEVFPRKEAKQPTRDRAWPKALKKMDADRLIAAAAEYADWLVRANKQDFVMLPTTWLNQERWNDERSTPRQPTSRLDGHLALIRQIAEEEQQLNLPQIGPS